MIRASARQAKIACTAKHRRVVLLLIPAMIAVSCGNAPPAVVDVGLVGDTQVSQGPYEVRLLAIDDDGIGPSVLRWSTNIGEQGSGTAPLEAMPDDDSALGTRLFGRIPGQPFGAFVRWSVEVCDTRGACVVEPDARDFGFRVGLVPSAPSLTRVSPSSGPSSGGLRVELRGEDLRPGARVFFGDVEGSSVEWLRPDLVSAISPALPPGVSSVRLVNPDGAGTILVDAFTVEPSPLITGVEPAVGPAAGGTSVRVAGENFSVDVSLFLGGVACRSLRLVDSETLECIAPPSAPGAVDVEVRHELRGRGILENGYRFLAAPTVNAVEPDQGTRDGGTLIIVRGDALEAASEVFIDAVPCSSVVLVTARELTCVTPPGVVGAVDVEVLNPDGQRGRLIGGFAYVEGTP